MPVFGDRAFTKVVKVRWGHMGGPYSHVAFVLIVRGNWDMDTNVHNEKRVWGHSEKGAIIRPTKEASEETNPADTILDFQLPKTWQNNSTQSVEFCYGRTGKPIQHLHKATQPASKGFSMESNKYMCYEEKTWHIGKGNVTNKKRQGPDKLPWQFEER